MGQGDDLETAIIMPSVEALAAMPAENAREIRQYVHGILRMRNLFGIFGLVLAFLSLLVCVGSFTFLIYTGHPGGATAILGAGTLGLIGKFINPRGAVPSRRDRLPSQSVEN